MADRQHPVKLTTNDGQTYRYAGKWRFVVISVPYLGAERYGPVWRVKASDSLTVAKRAARETRNREITTLYDTWGVPTMMNPWL